MHNFLVFKNLEKCFQVLWILQVYFFTTTSYKECYGTKIKMESHRRRNSAQITPMTESNQELTNDMQILTWLQNSAQWQSFPRRHCWIVNISFSINTLSATWWQYQDGFEHPTTCQQLRGSEQNQSSTQEHWDGVIYVCYPDYETQNKWNSLLTEAPI